MMNLLDGSEHIENQNPSSTTSDQTEYRGQSAERNIKRSSSLLVSRNPDDKLDYRSPRRSVSLFEDEDKSLPPLPRHIMTLGRKYRDSGKINNGTVRRENFCNYKNDKIQEETLDDSSKAPNISVAHVPNGLASGQMSEGNSVSISSSNTNFIDTASSVSAKSSETSPNESTSNVMDYNYSCKSDASKEFENRLLAAENLIKESKLRNLGPSSFDINLNSSYKDTDKCNKESLGSISETTSSERRRSYIPSLRMRSGSLTREPTEHKTRCKSYTGSQDASGTRAATPERSILSKFFKSGSSKDGEGREKQQKPSGQRRISRFLRPDFFDTPREESQYVKDKEAQKAAENERRKSRFSRKKSENKELKGDKSSEAKPPKELKNEANSITKEQSDISFKDDKSDRDISSLSEDAKPRFEKQTTKNSFLHSLEKKLEKFRAGDDSAKSVVNNGNLIEQKIRSLRESSAPPEECPCTESSLIKRAVSVEDLPLYNTNVSPAKGKVSSVLGLFKNIDTKSTSSGQRPQGMIFSKLRKNSYKGSRSDSMTDGEIASTSKIPTKVSKSEIKSLKKKSDETKLSGKSKADSKKSLPKELAKDTPKITTSQVSLKAKSSSPEKVNKEVKKCSPEKTVDKKSDSSADNSKSSKALSPEKCTEQREKGSSEILPVKQTNSIGKLLDSIGSEGKKIEKGRKGSVPYAVKNGSVKSLEKVEDLEKKVKKTVKAKESNDKESSSSDGTKKKKIVRVVKKVVKKSPDSSDSKSDGKEKPRKSLSKKGSSTSNETNSDTQISNGIDKRLEGSSKLDSENNIGESVPSKAPKPRTIINNNKSDETFIKDNRPEKSVSKENSTSAEVSELTLDGIKITENDQSSITDVVSPAKPPDSRSNRNSLKLDLSKIPQHTFRAPQILKKDSVQTDMSKTEPKADTELPKLSLKAASTSPEDAKKLIQNLSKITHHASMEGKKISIDKSLGSKDVAELKKEFKDSYNICQENSTSQYSSEFSPPYSSPQVSRDQNEIKHGNDTRAEISEKVCDSIANHTDVLNHQSNESDTAEYKNEDFQDIATTKASLNLNLPTFDPNPIPPPKDSPNDHLEDMCSPNDDTESFDSWSICSADMNHTRSELQSPTSPAHSPSSRGDQPESIVDRIRRRSFYSRFNDRKRKSSLNAPPPGVSLPVSTPLPRKFSFNRSREKEQDKLSSYTSPTKRYPEKSYNLYNDEIQPYRRSPIDRDKHSDVGTASSYSRDLRSPKEQYGNSLSSSYDPLRRYTRSPTLDTSSIRRKYYSTDYGMDNDLSPYRSSLSSSLLNDNLLESYSKRNFNTLPRKYGSTVSSSEPKTAEYYEELLAPSNSNYLTSRKTPTFPDSLSSRDNGYHNGNLESPEFKAEKWKTGTDKTAGLNTTEMNDERLGDQIRDKSQNTNESMDLLSNASAPQLSTSIE